jgi:tetratricopeptide (TPR) repeat protein
VAEALSLQEQAMEHAAAMRVMSGYALYAARLSESYLLTDLLEDASTFAGRALALSRAHKERGHEAYALRLLGEIAARRKPLERERALAHYQHALALADELGMRPLQAHCHLGFGAFYAKIGRREPARAGLSAAIELYRAMEMTFWLPQAQAALAQVEAR